MAATAAACTMYMCKHIFEGQSSPHLKYVCKTLFDGVVNGETQTAGIKHVLEPGILFVTEEATNN